MDDIYEAFTRLLEINLHCEKDPSGEFFRSNIFQERDLELAENRMFELFYQRFPDGNWKLFWRQLVEVMDIAREQIEIGAWRNDEIEYWFKRLQDYFEFILYA